MKYNELNVIRSSVKEKRPLIHCITNPISINQCANALLAVGARPIMAEHPEEVKEITVTADSLLLNLGNITDVRMKSMLISAEAAGENNIPCTLDIVGVACSNLRRDFANKVIEKNIPTLIKGNYSEIIALYNQEYKASGVDTEPTLDRDFVSGICVDLAQKYCTMVLASGKTDIITDGKKLFYIENGVNELSSVTGTGCMLGTLCSCYLSVNKGIDAVITACGVLGICGELSQSSKGIGSFFVSLMDNLSCLSDDDINERLKIKEIILP